MKRLAALFLTTIVTFNASAEAPSKLDEQALRKETASLISMISDGGRRTESNIQKIVVGNYGEDWGKTAAVFFVIAGVGGGGNEWTEYVAFFTENKDLPDEKMKKKFRFISLKQVGGSFIRSITTDNISDDGEVISAESMIWQYGDGHCCPTGKEKIHLTLGRYPQSNVVEYK
jgi:hypothetical protein